MNVFADTSALYALLVRDDLMHSKARDLFALFSRSAVQLVSSSYVLLESTALLQSRIGLAAVLDFNAKIVPLLDLVWVDAAWHDRAMQRLLARADRNLSLVDCLSFEIMEMKDIRVAFSFDRHFEENGFELAAVPLADTSY